MLLLHARMKMQAPQPKRIRVDTACLAEIFAEVSMHQLHRIHQPVPVATPSRCRTLCSTLHSDLHPNLRNIMSSQCHPLQRRESILLGHSCRKWFHRMRSKATHGGPRAETQSLLFELPIWETRFRCLFPRLQLASFHALNLCCLCIDVPCHGDMLTTPCSSGIRLRAIPGLPDGDPVVVGDSLERPWPLSSFLGFLSARLG